MDELPIQLTLVAPPPGIDFGVQRGSGANYETLFVQRSAGGDLSFDFSIRADGDGKSGRPNFKGPFVQGPPVNRFLYIDIGTYAGQKNTPWSRRMKVPLAGITWALVRTTLGKPGSRLAARLPGTGKDGGPSCATVKLLGDWHISGR